MERNSHVVALNGSLRDDSRTRIALQTALVAADDAGATDTTLVDLREYDLPQFDADARDAGDAPALRRTVAAADAVLLGTPNYHGSFSGPLKNALDYCGRDELAGTVVGLLEVAGGDYPGSAVAHLRTVARTLNAWTLPREVAIPSSRTTFRAGAIDDDAIAARVRDLGTDLARYAGVADYPDLAATNCEPAAGD